MEKLIIAGKKINTESKDLLSASSVSEISKLEIFSNLPQKEAAKAEKELFAYFNKGKNAAKKSGEEDTSS